MDGDEEAMEPSEEVPEIWEKRVDILSEVRHDIKGIQVGGELTLTIYRMQGDDRWQCSLSGPCPPHLDSWQSGEEVAEAFLSNMGVPVGGVIIL